MKRFFWSSPATNWVFAELPKPLVHLGKNLFERITSFFTGEFDRVLVDSTGRLGTQDYYLGDDIEVNASQLEL